MYEQTMVNQQATTHQLAWLAGIWDGEGTFGIYPSGSKYVGRLTLSNTCPIMINEITKIIESCGARIHVWQETESRKPNHKKAYHLTLNKLEDVKNISALMLPYLISKKARAEILIRFIDSRLKYERKVNRDPKTGHILGVITQGYEDQEDMYLKMKELNQTGIKVGASETTR